MSPVGRLLRQHPHWGAASHVLETLTRAGHQALLAGGCVRDALLGVVAQDLDVASSATPDQVIALFPKTIEVGKSFGVVRVIANSVDLEVATFRLDGKYEDGRRPESVQFTNAREDALRRDFTVNALFYDALADRVDDHVGGLLDLPKKILRTVGDPSLRFAEDHLRLLRAVRFAVQLGFAIEEKTWNEVRLRAGTINSVSLERVRDELFKMMKKGGRLGPELLHRSGLQGALFPALDVFATELMKGADLLADCAPSRTIDFVFARWLAPVLAHHPSFDVDGVIGRLKLSRVDAKNLRRRLDLVARPSELRAASLGARILAYDDVVVREAWDLIEALRGPDPSRAEVAAGWERILVDGKLPRPWLVGDDLLDHWKGSALGHALRAAYEAQLEGRVADREAALTWAKAWNRIG